MPGKIVPAAPVPPFVTFVASAVPMVFDNSMSYYEALCALWKWLQDDVINVINNNASVTNEYIDLTNEYTAKFIELKNYVDTYFDNLDVQEEINNKLDAMVEDGTLQEIITTYIQANVAWVFDTVADMKDSTNLINGSYAKTLGFYSLNDGGGATYYINNTGVADEHATIAIDTLLAHIVPDTIVTPEQYGAYGDDTNDDSTALQLAINSGKEVRCDKTYLVNTGLDLVTGTRLTGMGTLRQANNINDTIINIYNINDVVIDGLTVCNDSSQTGTPATYNDKSLVNIEDSSNIKIRNCYFHDAYKLGIEVKSSSDIEYSNNIFKNATYDMLMLLPEVENVVVKDSTFDTITSDLNLAYLFATGANDYTPTYTFAAKNITVDNCKFLNNPKWEGIDTHACVNFVCTNNYVYNCYRGIMAKYDVRIKISDSKKHDNLVFANNTIEGTSASAMPAIITGGDPTYFSKNITIENNKANGWGASGTNNNAAIDVEHAKYVDINRNTITNSKGSHLYMINVTYGNVNENTFLETGRNVALLPYVGCWFINIKNNVIRNLSVNRQNAFNYQGIVNIEGNDIEGFNQPFYGTKTNMVGIVNQYTTQMGKSGNYVRNAYQLITHYCTDAVVKANTAATLSFTATINNGSYEVVTSARYSYDLCEGEEITITGAGSAGTDLVTTIVEAIDETHFKVKDMAETGVTNAAITTSESTWVAV